MDRFWNNFTGRFRGWPSTKYGSQVSEAGPPWPSCFNCSGITWSLLRWVGLDLHVIKPINYELIRAWARVNSYLHDPKIIANSESDKLLLCKESLIFQIRNLLIVHVSNKNLVVRHIHSDASRPDHAMCFKMAHGFDSVIFFQISSVIRGFLVYKASWGLKLIED